MASSRKAERTSKNTRRSLAIVPEQTEVGDQLVNLSLPERLNITNLLPSEGNLSLMRATQKLQTTLMFTDEEVEELGINRTVQPGGGFSWTWKKERDVELPVSSKMFSFVQESLQKLDETGKLAMGYVSLWDKFVAKREQA